ncbi:MAG: hypothetical protein WAK26_14345 [Terracidiphilus sp.]|jgi:hypothetical protein
MNANLERRLAALKAQISGNPVVLLMADGSERTIRGDNKNYFRLAALLDGEPESYIDDPDLNALRDAVHIEETGGMFQLLAAIASGPNSDGEEPGCVTIR